MKQDRNGDYVSLYIRGAVKNLARWVHRDDVELAFSQVGIFSTESDRLGKPRPTDSSELCGDYTKVINWKDKDVAEQGLEALSLITERARGNYDSSEEYDPVVFDKYLTYAKELARKAQKYGLLYDVGTGELAPDPSANTALFVELDLDALHQEEIVIQAQQSLNDTVMRDIHHPLVAVYSRTLLEAVCNSILKHEAPETYAQFKEDKVTDVNKLAKEVGKILGLDQAPNSSRAMSNFAPGLEKLARGVGEVRNRANQAHGREQDRPASKEEIRLTLDVTQAWCRYVVAEYRKCQERKGI
ncbi:abortive infection family protein [uncultured Corynebacterium sp.]|uniref:abortive infection family protein n=1 Tax=uncultured Corynebacterium sp. TaxID=159447 RepID=UPI0025966363|nr:abortive infection family protein [uncultured Corynebacterium sp.]